MASTSDYEEDLDLPYGEEDEEYEKQLPYREWKGKNRSERKPVPWTVINKKDTKRKKHGGQVTQRNARLQADKTAK